MKYIHPLFLLCCLCACTAKIWKNYFIISKDNYSLYLHHLNNPNCKCELCAKKLDKSHISDNAERLSIVFPIQEIMLNIDSKLIIMDTMLKGIKNPNSIKTLDLAQLSGVEINFFIKKHLHKFLNIEVLFISNCIIDTFPREFWLWKLKSLQIQGGILNNLPCISKKMINLKSINIYDIANKEPWLYDFLICSLKNLPNLEYLSVKPAINRNYLSDDTSKVFLYKELRTIKKLEQIYLPLMDFWNFKNYKFQREVDGSPVLYTPLYYEELAKKINYDSLVKVRQK